MSLGEENGEWGCRYLGCLNTGKTSKHDEFLGSQLVGFKLCEFPGGKRLLLTKTRHSQESMHAHTECDMDDEAGGTHFTLPTLDHEFSAQ